MKNYNINKNHFLYIIYISCFLPPPPQYKHGKNEVTVNVQVPKQNICLTQNTCPWLCWWVGSLVFRQGPLEAKESKNSKPLSHHSKKSLVNNKWHLRSNQSQILNKF